MDTADIKLTRMNFFGFKLSLARVQGFLKIDQFTGKTGSVVVHCPEFFLVVGVLKGVAYFLELFKLSEILFGIFWGKAPLVVEWLVI